MATHFPPRANAAQLPATTTTAATSPTRAGGRADARAGAGENDDDTPGPRRPPDPERARLLELTHLDPQDEQPHFDIRGTAVGSSANDVIVHMRDDHIEVRINFHPLTLEGFDPQLFTHLTNMLGIADIAHLSEVSRATHTLMLKVPVAQLQQQRWTQLQQQWATNHQRMIAPLQSELAALKRAYCSLICCNEVLPSFWVLATVASLVTGLVLWMKVGFVPNDEYLLYRNLAMGFALSGVASLISIISFYCAIDCNRHYEAYKKGNSHGQKEVIDKIRNAPKTLDKDSRSSLARMRKEPMPKRFINVAVLESMRADAAPGSFTSSTSSTSSSSSSSSSTASSSSGPARSAPLSREQQRQNMALIVSRHQIWQILTQEGYEIAFNPDVAYPGDRSEPTASTDPQINALFSDEDALVLVARELSRRPDVPEPSEELSNLVAAVGDRVFGSESPEPEPENPSQSVASTTSGPSSSSISSAGAGSGWSARTELESRRKLIVELLQRQGYDAEYEVGRTYPGDGTRTVPPDADFLSYGPLFSDPQALAMIRTYVTQAGAQRQPAAVRVADDGLPVATSIEDAERLQREGYEVKFHVPDDAS